MWLTGKLSREPARVRYAERGRAPTPPAAPPPPIYLGCATQSQCECSRVSRRDFGRNGRPLGCPRLGAHQWWVLPHPPRRRRPPDILR